MFVAVTLLLPRGIVGTVQHWWAMRKSRRVENGGAVPLPDAQPAE
jgi:hypothetical protein